MRVLLIVTMYNILNVILAQFDIINEELGEFHFQAATGNLPMKYIPLSEQDQKASDKAADFIDFIQLVPNIDPLKIPLVQALDIDVPFLLLSGKINLENLVVAGVKQMQLHGIELRLINLRSDLNITIPHLYFEGDVHLKASLSFMPVMFKCHLSAYLFDVGIAMTSGGFKTQAPTVGEVLQFDSAAVKVDIRDVVFNLTNMVMGEEVIEEYEYEDSPATQLFSNRLSSSSASTSASDGNIFNDLLQTALNMANKELYKISIDYFKEYLLSDTY